MKIIKELSGATKKLVSSRKGVFGMPNSGMENIWMY
jgi:hypothetical protein